MPKSHDKVEDDSPVSIDTADRLRAAASPTRMRLFKALSWMGPSRTSDLADELGLPHNSVSYHLRGLERAGYIRREEGEDKRESWWSLASSAGVSFAMTEDLKGPALDLVRLDHQVTAELIARGEAINPDGRWPTLSAAFGAELTEDEVRELYSRLKEIVDEVHGRGRRTRSERAVGPNYYLAVNFFPVQLPD